MNTHDHHDDEPLPGEDELKALYRSLPRKEPTPALDEAVRRTAAEAVRPARAGRIPRWPVAAASAAVLVLAAGLSWRWYEQPSSVPQIPAQVEMREGAPAPSAPVAAPPAHPADTAPVAIAGHAAAPTAGAAPTTAQNAPRSQAAERPMAKARVMAPALATREATPAVAAPAPMTITSQAAEPAPAPPPPAAMQAAPAPEVASEARADYSGHAVMVMKAAAAPMRAAPVIDPTAANPTDTPAQELDKIRQLFAQQRRDEALKRLTAFQQVHPDLSLPDDLRAQLPDHE
jgi:Meckel syndrome type 1 protein